MFNEPLINRHIKSGFVHIRLHPRSTKKHITTIEGLATDLNLRKILNALKQVCSVGGSVIRDKDDSEIIQLQGDQRDKIKDFFVKYTICTKEEIKIHGY